MRISICKTIIETEMFRFHSSWSRCVGNFSQHSRRKKFKLHLPPHLYSESSSRGSLGCEEKKSFIVPFLLCTHVSTMTLLLLLIYVTIWEANWSINKSDNKCSESSGKYWENWLDGVLYKIERLLPISFRFYNDATIIIKHH